MKAVNGEAKMQQLENLQGDNASRELVLAWLKNAGFETFSEHRIHGVVLGRNIDAFGGVIVHVFSTVRLGFTPSSTYWTALRVEHAEASCSVFERGQSSVIAAARPLAELGPTITALLQIHGMAETVLRVQWDPAEDEDVRAAQ